MAKDPSPDLDIGAYLWRHFWRHEPNKNKRGADAALLEQLNTAANATYLPAAEHNALFRTAAQNILDTLTPQQRASLPTVIHEYLLHSPAKRATNRKTMNHEVPTPPTVDNPLLPDLETFIEQAKADTTEHPKPNTSQELQAITDEATHLRTTLDELRSLELPATRLEAEVAIKGLHNIAKRSQETAKALGLHAISQGHISRVRLAELLGVHQNTVARWYNETQEPNAEPR